MRRLICAAISKEKPSEINRFQRTFGPSGAIRTLGPVNPNHVRYQLRYTRLFDCHDYSTKIVRFKVFSCLWSFMWSKRFLARFCCLEKSRKFPCCKGFRALAVSIMDRQRIAPKPGALPTALCPDTFNYYSR